MSAATEERQLQAAAPAPLQLHTAYAVCRHITRSAAKNFYYAFLVLPRRKRNALSAVYAFMRHADDISDDPSLSMEEKAGRLEALLESMHAVVGGRQTDDPVLMALADTQRRFNIPVAYFDKLIAGTAMDVFGVPDTADDPRTAMHLMEYEANEAVRHMMIGEPGAPKVLCATFSELYTYCYHVASVVGLVCIRIFGYRDRDAEALAEKTGLAFQLTNIIRDIREDAAMGRVYLPAEDLVRFGLTPIDFATAEAERLRPLLDFEAQRAREFYESAPKLLPFIDEESRPALWVLVEIYRRLLEKITLRNFDVVSDKVRLTTWEKLKVVGRGAWRRLQ